MTDAEKGAAESSANDSKLKRFINSCIKAMDVLSGTPGVLKLVWEASPTNTALIVGLGMLLAVTPICHLWIGKLIVDVVTQSLMKSGALSFAELFSSAGMAKLLPLLWTLAGLEILQSVLHPIFRYYESKLGDLLSRSMNLRMMRKANSFVDITFFESSKFYDMMQMAQNASYRPAQMLNNFVGIWRQCIQFLAVTIAFTIMQPLLSLFVLLSSLPTLAMQFKHSKESMDMSIWETTEARRMYYYRMAITDKFQASELRMFGLGNFFLERYLTTCDQFFKKHSDLRRTQMGRNMLLSTISTITDSSVYSYIAIRTVMGAFTIGDFYFYSNSLGQIQSQLSNLIWSVTSLYEDNLYMNKYFEFLNLEPTMQLPDPAYAFQAPKPIRKGIEFRNVSFSYQGSERKVLDGVSFTLRKGEKIALVGENGAGKTTIVKLLGRLYDPTEGEILIDGINLKDIDLDSWRSQVGVIFQDFVSYQLNAGENIGVGQVNFIDDEIRVKAAAQRGGASQFIEKLPNQYETQLGYWFGNKEEVTDLSGGEWQKIGLSRLFMRAPEGEINGHDKGVEAHLKNGAAQVLILDEPTASLDVESEHDIYLRFQELTRDKTTILISHRFSTVRMAGQILLLIDGKIREQGSHDELMAQGGEYSRLYKLQADRYN